MEEETKKTENNVEKTQAEKDSNRRGFERRCRKSLGHMYITTIGWICRREKSRRKDELCDEDD